MNMLLNVYSGTTGCYDSNGLLPSTLSGLFFIYHPFHIFCLSSNMFTMHSEEQEYKQQIDQSVAPISLQRVALKHKDDNPTQK
jgi:hypothetical protein